MLQILDCSCRVIAIFIALHFLRIIWCRNSPGSLLWGNSPTGVHCCENKGNSPKYRNRLHLLAFLPKDSKGILGITEIGSMSAMCPSWPVHMKHTWSRTFPDQKSTAKDGPFCSYAYLLVDPLPQDLQGQDLILTISYRCSCRLSPLLCVSNCTLSNNVVNDSLVSQILWQNGCKLQDI